MFALKKRIELLSGHRQKHRRPQSGAGFTLIEVLISMAIFGILTAIVFTSLSKEKSRTAVKQAADQLQVDVQAAQANAQAGLVRTGVTVAGYGLVAATTDRFYRLFVDASGSGYTPDLYDSGGGSTDQTLIYRSLPSDVVIQQLSLSGSATTYNRADIVYHLPNATLSLLGDISQPLTGLTITLKHQKLNLCYAVSIQKVGGIVSKRQLSTCP